MAGVARAGAKVARVDPHRAARSQTGRAPPKLGCACRPVRTSAGHGASKGFLTFYSFILKNGSPSDYEYHHIVPFDNAHYNQHLHNEIDSILNLIPLMKDDHSRFPNKSNFYVKLKIENDKLKFYSIKDNDDFIEILNTNHLNIEKLKTSFISHNEKLLKEIIL